MLKTRILNQLEPIEPEYLKNVWLILLTLSLYLSICAWLSLRTRIENNCGLQEGEMDGGKVDPWENEKLKKMDKLFYRGQQLYYYDPKIQKKLESQIREETDHKNQTGKRERTILSVREEMTHFI